MSKSVVLKKVTQIISWAQKYSLTFQKTLADSSNSVYLTLYPENEDSEPIRIRVSDHPQAYTSRTGYNIDPEINEYKSILKWIKSSGIEKPRYKYNCQFIENGIVTHLTKSLKAAEEYAKTFSGSIRIYSYAYSMKMGVYDLDLRKSRNVTNRLCRKYNLAKSDF